MKTLIIHKIIITAIILAGSFGNSTHIKTQLNTPQLQQDTLRPDNEALLVTFKCESCKIKNKFKVSGKEEFTLKKVIFPLEKKLKPGKYEMTYWQNKVQQIHLPFTVKPNTQNIITVKK